VKLTFFTLGGHEFPLKTTAGAAIPSPRPSSATTPTPAPAEPDLPRGGSQVSAPDPSLAVGKPQ
jgi:hypothetical protein